MVIPWSVGIALIVLVEDVQGQRLLIDHVEEPRVWHWLRQVTLGLIASWRVDTLVLESRHASATEAIRVARYPVVRARPWQHLLLLAFEQL